MQVRTTIGDSATLPQSWFPLSALAAGMVSPVRPMDRLDKGPDKAFSELPAAPSAIWGSAELARVVSVWATTSERLLPGSALSAGLLLLVPASMFDLVHLERLPRGLLPTGLSTGLLCALPTSVHDVCSVQIAEGTSLHIDVREHTAATQHDSSMSCSKSRDWHSEERRDELCKLCCSLRSAFFMSNNPQWETLMFQNGLRAQVLRRALATPRNMLQHGAAREFLSEVSHTLKPA